MTAEQPHSRLARSIADPTEFTLTFELVPGPGGRSREISRILQLARDVAEDGRIQAMSITENAGGHPALSPEALGHEIRAHGSEVIIHLSCKDKNRNQMESLLFAWDRLELHNLLVIAGDYPQKGFRGHPKPVFDLDPIHALDLICAMNRGRTFTGGGGLIQSTSFLKGVAVSPFKLLESEQRLQYFKLERKAAAGADFVITQLGFDARKFHELLLYLRQHDIDLPVLGNVFVPSLPVADLMHGGGIPGCIIPDRLHAQFHREADSPDRGRRARLDRAAKLLAVQEGMGYAGAHIGGPGLTFEDLDYLLNTARDLKPAWRDLIPELSWWPADAYYYYRLENTTGLNGPEPQPTAPARKFHPAYTLARLTHDLIFSPSGFLHKPMRALCLAVADSPLQGFWGRMEHMLKAAMFGCQNCGDCTLAELAYLCPQWGCAKYLLNGACGGSRNGWCEVYPGRRKCIYVKAYERLKSRGRERSLADGYVPPRNWSLNNTSSWINYFRGVDHAGRGGLSDLDCRTDGRPAAAAAVDKKNLS